MRTPVKVDNPRFVDGLEEQQNMRRCLDDGVVAQWARASVGPADARHAIGQAAFYQREILRPFRRTPANRIGSRRFLPRFFRQRRDPTVRRVDDERSAIVEFTFDHLERGAC